MECKWGRERRGRKLREQENRCELVSWADTEVQFTEKCPSGFPGLISVLLRLRVVTLSAW